MKKIEEIFPEWGLPPFPDSCGTVRVSNVGNPASRWPPHENHHFKEKIMKTRHLLILAIGLTLPSLSFAQVLVQSYNDDWAFTFGANLGGTGTSGTNTSEQLDDLSLSKYTGILDLTRVVITVTKPLPPNSPDFTAVLQNVGGAGTNTFNSVAFSNRTTIDTTTVQSDLANNGGPFRPASVVFLGTDTATPAPFTIATTQTKSFAVAPQGTSVYFDSSSMGTMTSAELNTVFRDGSATFLFPLVARVAAVYNRDASVTDFDFFASGIDSGSISIEYYAIPEPSSLALLGLGAVGLLFRTRRRPARGQA